MHFLNLAPEPLGKYVGECLLKLLEDGNQYTKEVTYRWRSCFTDPHFCDGSDGRVHDERVGPGGGAAVPRFARAARPPRPRRRVRVRAGGVVLLPPG